MDILYKCLEATFNLTGEDEAEYIEEVKMFKYLGQLLDRLDDNWPAVIQNIRKARQLWDRLRKILQREGAEPDILAKFYCAVIQAVLFYWAETWLLSAPMVQVL